MCDLPLWKLPGSTKPQISVKPGAKFSIVTFSFQTLVKHLVVLNKSTHNIDITTYRRGGVMQNIIHVKLDIKVPTTDLMKVISLYLEK